MQATHFARVHPSAIKLSDTRKPLSAGSGDGDPRPTDITAIALAEPICGTSDRNTPARLPGSRCHLRRAASASGPDRVFLLLQSDANAFVFVQGCAARSIDPARGSDCCCADSVGPASLLFADMIFRRDSDRNPHALLDPRDKLEIALLDRLAALRGIGRDRVDVQLDRVPRPRPA